MALTDENMVMPVAPMCGTGYGNNGGFGFGGDGWWIILLLLFAGGGWGNGFGGYGMNNQLGYDFPWLINGQNGVNANVNAGFQNAMLNDGITSIRDGINGISTQLCNSTSNVQMALANGFAGVEAGANARQIADMQQAFSAQTAVTQGMNDIGMALQNCCCENRANIADLKYTVATENCADRTAAYQNTRDIIDSQTRGTQAILDKLCALEIDAKNDTIAQLRQELIYARGQASQIEQTAILRQGQEAEVDALYNRLSNCPVPTTPVYGRTPIFTCNNNNSGCGCGCSSF